MMTDIQQIVKMGQQLQARMKELQDALQTEELAASSGGGMVTARVTGKGDLKSIAIDPEVIDPDDPEMLEDLVVAAVAEAQNRARDFSEERMRGAAGGLPVNVPGLF
ncbi:MAG: YbaB/EbfC family nucleoid-associated protein [Gemmatimonadota bacterium]|nr:YbaB/EbfC family nucleoid-associated protein [Gemmatimonadota bacterium]